jgi:tRNA threonylcarbamoyladenosine biosynthesis protein TsaE
MPDPDKQKDLPTEITTRSPEETFELGVRVGGLIHKPTTLLLHGDLGSGKTLFTKGVAAALGIDPADVNSPSFTLINVHEGRLPLYHVDLYRLEGESIGQLGLEEILEKDAVTVIEWAERLGWEPSGSIDVTLDYVDDSTRRIVIRDSE